MSRAVVDPEALLQKILARIEKDVDRFGETDALSEEDGRRFATYARTLIAAVRGQGKEVDDDDIGALADKIKKDPALMELLTREP